MPAQASRDVIRGLPPEVRGPYVEAFVPALLLPGVPLRATAAAQGPGRGAPVPREDSSLREIERAIAAIAPRQERWSLDERVADRAGVEVTPPALRLLARLGEHGPELVDALAHRLGVEAGRVREIVPKLAARGLLMAPADGVLDLTPAGAAAADRVVAVRRDGLRGCWTAGTPTSTPSCGACSTTSPAAWCTTSPHRLRSRRSGRGRRSSRRGSRISREPVARLPARR